MRPYNTQISDPIALSIKNSCTLVLPPFFRYLMEKVQSIHYGDLNPTPVEEMEGTYAPHSGVPYYFTASGYQLQKMPQDEKNVKDKRNKEPPHDPRMQENISYSYSSWIPVHFPLALSGSGPFIWLSSDHGAEGPKDIFWSLLKYKEDMPQEHLSGCGGEV